MLSTVVINVESGIKMDNRLLKLPLPWAKGNVSLEEVLARRRSVRQFDGTALSLQQLLQLLWASQGLRRDSSWARTVPSAGATYPLEIFVVCGNKGVEGLEGGVYQYVVNDHSLGLHLEGDFRQVLAQAALGQDMIIEAPVNIVICAVYGRTTQRYGKRGERYVFMEAGHAGQNIYLQATALGLGTVAIGAFHDEEVKEVLQLEEQFNALYIMPVGKPAIDRTD